MKEKRRVKIITKFILTIFLSGWVAMGLLALVYCLPTENIKAHVRRGSEVYLQESAEFQYAGGFVSTILDNFTDALILNKTIYSTGNPLQDAVYVPSMHYSDGAEDMSLFSELNGDGKDGVIENYSRYWHGYLIILKPLLSVLDYSDVIILNQICQLLVICIFLYLLIESGLKKYLVPYIAMLAVWNPATVSMSLQYSPCFYVAHLASIFILLRYQKQRRTGIPYDQANDIMIFLVAGMMTSFFDFLTYPIVTLGVPLVVWFVVHQKDACNQIKAFFAFCISWGIGYLGFWAEKWIYGSIVSGSNIIADAINQVGVRVSTSDGTKQLGRFETILYLLRYTFAKWPYLICFILLLAGIVLYHRKRGITRFDRKLVLVLFITGLLPFAWYFIAANHSAVHPRLVYRAMGVTILAWGTVLMGAKSFDRQLTSEGN